MRDGNSASDAGYTTHAHRMMAERTATRDAGFFIPHLRPGMRLLDCGCGQGTITVGLAELVTPGEVVGVDVDVVQIERARNHAREQGADNVRFEQADAYTLPYPD